MTQSNSRSSASSRWRAARQPALVVAAAVSLVLSAASPANAASKAPTSASVTLSATSIASGTRITVSGTLKAGERAVPRAKVTLQDRTGGSSKWITLKSGITSTRGVFSAKTVAMTKNTDFRLRYAGDRTHKASTSGAQGARIQQSVTVTSWSSLTPITGDSLTLSGHASPGLVGQQVALQVSSASGWTDMATSVITGSGSFSVAGIVTQAGAHQYRASVAARPGVSGANSDSLTATASAWFTLDPSTAIASNAQSLHTQSQIGAVFYPNSIQTGVNFFSGLNYGQSVFNLAGRCTAFRTQIGWGATSRTTTGVATFTATGDDTTLAQATLSFSQSQALSLNVSGVVRLTIRDNPASSSNMGGTFDVWGSPQVLCTSAPVV